MTHKPEKKPRKTAAKPDKSEKVPGASQMAASDTSPAKPAAAEKAARKTKPKAVDGSGKSMKASVGEAVKEKAAAGPSLVAIRLQLRTEPGCAVFVAGSFNAWRAKEFALTEGETGTYTAELHLSPGEYEYKFIVNGRWQADPVAEGWAPNPFGSLNSVLKVEG